MITPTPTDQHSLGETGQLRSIECMSFHVPLCVLNSVLDEARKTGVDHNDRSHDTAFKSKIINGNYKMRSALETPNLNGNNDSETLKSENDENWRASIGNYMTRIVETSKSHINPVLNAESSLEFLIRTTQFFARKQELSCNKEMRLEVEFDEARKHKRFSKITSEILCLPENRWIGNRKNETNNVLEKNSSDPRLSNDIADLEMLKNSLLNQNTGETGKRKSKVFSSLECINEPEELKTNYDDFNNKKMCSTTELESMKIRNLSFQRKTSDERLKSTSELDRFRTQQEQLAKIEKINKKSCKYDLQRPISPDKQHHAESERRKSMGKRSRTSMNVAKIEQHDMEDNVLSVLLPACRKGRRCSRSPSTKKFEVPSYTRRESAILFVDMSGFTKLSTMLELEAFSETINAYFELIVDEILQHNGDILKFAGDALFAEWTSDPSTETKELALAKCTAAAAYCGAQIVKKYSDFKVSGCSVMLNVHCGLGAGHLVGLHVEDTNNTRRQYLCLGDPIDQVAEAEALASHGELAASREAIKLLSKYCRIPLSILTSDGPAVIAHRSDCGVMLAMNYHKWTSTRNLHTTADAFQQSTTASNLKNMSNFSLENLRMHLSLYPHPVFTEDEMSKIHTNMEFPSHSTAFELAHKKRRAEAELRSVYTMFIKPEIDAKITGNDKEDEILLLKLSNVMKTVCRELDRYQGQLLNYIIDDKGVVLIATFGLRYSTFPNMVAGYALPATLSIRKCLRDELNVDCRIGATYGKAYCGVVGGMRRHDYSILGPSVNLAARLMCSSENKGILIDESVRFESRTKYVFKSLAPVVAKGYSQPVPTFELIKSIKRNSFIEEVNECSGSIFDSEGASNFCTFGLIEERCLQRIDLLDVQTRNVLQTCAVLGNEFDLSDVLRLFKGNYCRDTVEKALQTAIEENILIEDRKTNHEQKYNEFIASIQSTKTPNLELQGLKIKNMKISDDRTFKFTHEIWWKSLLKIMLKDRKTDLNRRVSMSLARALPIEELT